MKNHRLELKLFILALCATPVMLSLSCGTHSTADGTPSAHAPTTPQALPTSTPNGQGSKLRDVDFKNFTYPWYPSFGKSTSRQVSLHNGKLEIEEDQKAGIANLSLELDNVSFVALRGDGKEEAIVTVAGVSGVNRFVGSIFIYSLENEKPKLLWQHETGDRAEGGLRRIAVESGTLTLEEYVRSEGDGGLCCPKTFTRSNYRWNGKSFEKIKSEIFSNDHKTAEFFGYPNTHP